MTLNLYYLFPVLCIHAISNWLCRYCIFLWLITASSDGLAQAALADSALYNHAVENAVGKVLRSQKSINIGKPYTDLRFDIKRGHPFFLSELPLTGMIEYYAVTYRNQEFQYDLIWQQLVFENVTGKKIALVNEKVKWFSIEGHTFYYFANLPDGMESGYYEILAENGDLKLLARREKKIEGHGDPARPFIGSSSKYYLKKDGTYHRVRNANAVARLLSGESKNRLSSEKSGKEEQMRDLVRQYVNGK
jgi:hypothetical protein